MVIRASLDTITPKQTNETPSGNVQSTETPAPTQATRSSKPAPLPQEGTEQVEIQQGRKPENTNNFLKLGEQAHKCKTLQSMR
jgi:hypothetical protein